MKVAFTKMNGAGNDFVIVDNRSLKYQLTTKNIELICDRHRGVGGDGLLAVEPAQKGADFRFRYFNADGGEAEMCGNGARCFARFASRLEEKKSDVMTFETIVGNLQAECHGDEVLIKMSMPRGFQANCPVGISQLPAPVTHLDTGVPHAVLFVDNVDQANVTGWGSAIRHAACFAPKGVNANFVQITGPSKLKVRTFERGVEGETLACGTGITAAALVHHLQTGDSSPIRVETRGGDLIEIAFTKADPTSFASVTMKGPADFVFEGHITLA